MEINLLPAEQDLLIRLLETALTESRVEAHRTHYSPEYREQVLKEEKMVRGLLTRLGKATVAMKT